MYIYKITKKICTYLCRVRIERYVRICYTIIVRQRENLFRKEVRK